MRINPLKITKVINNILKITRDLKYIEFQASQSSKVTN